MGALLALWLGSIARADGGAFVPLPDLSFARYEAAAGVLSDGSVLLYGPSYDADVFTPWSPGFVEAGVIPAPRFLGTLVALPNGDALVVGGSTDDPRTVRFDATQRAWTWGPAMSVPRARAQVAPLSDGRVLIAGGYGADGTALATAEVFDPSTETFAATGSMPRPRQGGVAETLADGRVLVAGGLDASGYDDLCAILYDPASGSFRAAGCFYLAQEGHYLPASARLADGRVLLSGGIVFTSASTQQASTDAELYDPTTNTWSSQYVGARTEHTMTRLADGTVLVVGGKDSWGYPIAQTEVFDPVIGIFRSGPTLAQARFGHTATALPGNRVLVAGGQVEGGAWSASAEWYVGDLIFTDAF